MKEARKKKLYLILTIFSLIMVVVMAIIIFRFSAENSEKSSQTSNNITNTVIEITQPDYQTLPVEKQQERFSITSNIVRKMAHFTEFFLLGLFAILSFKFFELYKDRKIKLSYLYAFIFSMLYAISDEIHQGFSEGRGPAIKDVLIDSSGALLAIMIVCLIFWLISRHNFTKHLEQA